jgi:DNA-binding IclR family transcriptional regulator
MPRDDPPAHLERLLEGSLTSVGSLELLLLLHGEPRRSWRADELSAALSSPSSWTALQLETLERADLIAGGTDGWRYAPGTHELERAMDDLARLWRVDRRRVTSWAFEPRARRRRRRRGHG